MARHFDFEGDLQILSGKLCDWFHDVLIIRQQNYTIFPLPLESKFWSRVIVDPVVVQFDDSGSCKLLAFCFDSSENLILGYSPSII